MKYPKQKDMATYIGMKCVFIGNGLERVNKIETLETAFFSDISLSTHEKAIDYKWEDCYGIKSKHKRNGWITGFGFCYDGKLYTESKFFKKQKMVKYVKVKVTPTGKELKILPENIFTLIHNTKSFK